MLTSLAGMSSHVLAATSTLIGNLVLFGILIGFLIIAALLKVNVYETFIEGSKQGFQVSVSLLPYLN
ncbi:MAG: hypothetical protein R6U27_10265 [Desulfobacterales bacterium]